MMSHVINPITDQDKLNPPPPKKKTKTKNKNKNKQLKLLGIPKYLQFNG